MGNLRTTLQTWRSEGKYKPLTEALTGVQNRYRRTMQAIHRERIIEAVRNAGAPKDLNRLFDLASRSFYGAISPIQSRYEFISLLGELTGRPPRTILEIGTASGGTLFMLTRVAAEDATIVSLDLPQGPFGGGYDESRIPLYEAFKRPKQMLRLLRADSHAASSLDAVRDCFGGKGIDFIFIDGDHTYEGVRQDFEMYGPLASPDGLIGFHDIVYASGVAKFWSEIKSGRKTREWIDPGQTKYGIGLISLSDE